MDISYINESHSNAENSKLGLHKKRFILDIHKLVKYMCSIKSIAFDKIYKINQNMRAIVILKNAQRSSDRGNVNN